MSWLKSCGVRKTQSSGVAAVRCLCSKGSDSGGRSIHPMFVQSCCRRSHILSGPHIASQKTPGNRNRTDPKGLKNPSMEFVGCLQEEK